MLARAGERGGGIGLDLDLREVVRGEVRELGGRQRAVVRRLRRDERRPLVASVESIAGASLSRRIDATTV